MTIAVGAKLGRYEIRSKLGEGGMGEVYLAQDTQLDRSVALKILTPGRDLARLEKQMEAAGAPWMPGRIPEWKDQ